MSDDSALLRRLIDERAIVDILHRYGHALDYGEPDVWLDLFEADAVYELHYREGLAPRAIGNAEVAGNVRRYQGSRALEDFARAHSSAPDRYHKHLTTSWQIALAGRSAHVDSYFTRLDAIEGGGIRIVAAGRYRDQMRRGEDKRWRFTRRVAEIEMQALS